MTIAYRQTILFKSHINSTSTTNEELIRNQYYNNYLKELNHQDLRTTIINKLFELKYILQSHHSSRFNKVDDK